MDALEHKREQMVQSPRIHLRVGRRDLPSFADLVNHPATITPPVDCKFDLSVDWNGFIALLLRQ
jgi:hypothetical protein